MAKVQERVFMKKLLGSMVYERIKKLIVIGALPMGTKVSESMLIERLGSTKAPVRDAIKQLASEGLMKVIPKSGTYIFKFDQEEFEEFLQYRHILETSAFKMLNEDNSTQLVEQLSSLYDQMLFSVENERPYEYIRLNDEYHQSIISMCGNRFIIESYETIAPKMSAIRNELVTSEEHIYKGLKQHGEIVEALKEHNLNKVLETLDNHILPSCGSFWKDKS